MVAFNQLYKLGTQTKALCDVDGLYVLAASDGKEHAMMLSNLTGIDLSLNIEGADLSNARFYVIDQDRLLSWASNANSIKIMK